MEPWTIDARRFIPDQKAVDYIFQNNLIKRYLKIGKQDDKLVLVGGKGSGKTLLLRYKSYLYRNTLSGYKFNASDNQLIEYLMIQTASISPKEVAALCVEEKWKNIWFITLSTMALKSFGAKLPEPFNKEFDVANDVSSIVSHLLNPPSRVDKLSKYSHLLLGALSQITSGTAIFVDNVDQGVEDVFKPYLANQVISHAEATNMWIYAQTSIIQNIYRITQVNSHIRIFATVRREVLAKMNDPVRVNYEEICSDLKYTKAELEEIFEKNIRLMDAAEYVDARQSTYLGRFLGLNYLPHPFARTEQGTPRAEKSFDFIFRHTYGRPRDVIQMGHSLHNDVTLQQNYRNSMQDAQRVDAVRYKVNSVSATLYESYKREIIPFTGETLFEDFLTHFSRSNVIQVSGVEDAHRPVLDQFYKFGLLGYVQRKGYGHQPVQTFLPVATHNFQDMKRPEPDYFLVHPSLDQALIDRSRFDGFYDVRNIIEDGSPFITALPNGLAHNDDRPQDIQFYLPAKAQGNRLEQPSPGYNQKGALIKYYQGLFSSQENYDAVFYWKYLRDFDSLIYDRALLKIADFLPKKVTEQGDIIARINRIPVALGYRIELKEEPNIECLGKFAKLLFGRFLTVGSFLLLDLPIAQIHDWLTHGNLLSQRVAGPADFRFLKDCFFIKGFPQNDDPRTLAAAKREVFNHLSEHEKQRLGMMRDRIKEALGELDWLNDEDYRLVEQNLLGKGWLNLSF